MFLCKLRKITVSVFRVTVPPKSNQIIKNTLRFLDDVMNTKIYREKHSQINRNPSTKKFSIKDFSSKCDQVRRNLRVSSHLLKKSLMRNLIFFVVTLPVDLNMLCVLKFIDFTKYSKFVRCHMVANMLRCNYEYVEEII